MADSSDSEPPVAAKPVGSERAKAKWRVARKVLNRVKAKKSLTAYHKRSFVYHMLNSKSKKSMAQTYRRFVMVVILCDVVIYAMATIPKLRADPDWRRLFKSSEAFTSSIFILEYLLRAVVVTEGCRYGQYGPVMGRIRYLLSTPALIDALATFPFFVEVGHNANFSSALGFSEAGSCAEEDQWSLPLQDEWRLPRTTPLRILRIWKLLRTEKYARAVAMTHRILWFNREILTAAFLNCATLVFLTSALLYYMPPNPNAVNSEFESLPSSMYLAVLMLTGQGLEVEGEVPWWTKIVIMTTSLFSVAVFAIPASMITWGFEAEATRLAKKSAARRRAKRHSEEEQDDDEPIALFADSESASSSDGGDFGFFADEERAWEEYEGAIVGSDDEDDAGKAKAKPGAAAHPLPRRGSEVERQEATKDKMAQVLSMLATQATRLDELSKQVSAVQETQKRMESMITHK